MRLYHKLGVNCLLLCAAARFGHSQSSGIGNSTLLSTSGYQCSIAPSQIQTCAPPVNGVYQATDNTFSYGGLQYTWQTSATVGGPLKAAASITNPGIPRWISDRGAAIISIGRAAFYDAFYNPSATPSALRFAVAGDGVGATNVNFNVQPDQGNLKLYGALAAFNCGSLAAAFSCVPVTDVFYVDANTGVKTGFLDIPLVSGWNNIYFNLSAAAAINFPIGAQPGSWTGSSYVDFMNTVNFTGVQYVDANGSEISKLDGSAFASGVNYNAVVVTPEPSTWAMLAIGFLALGAAARRKRNVLQ